MRFLVILATTVGFVAADPLRVASTHLYATNKEINSIVKNAETFMASQIHALSEPTSFARAFGDPAVQVKNGLFLTQPMRSPAQTRVNIVEREDSIGAHANAVGAASQGVFLREKFVQELAQLRH